jgi:hypothetical protein
LVEFFLMAYAWSSMLLILSEFYIGQKLYSTFLLWHLYNRQASRYICCFERNGFCIACKSWREFIQKIVGYTLNITSLWTVFLSVLIASWKCVTVFTYIMYVEFFPFNKIKNMFSITFILLHCPLFTNSISIHPFWIHPG